MHDSSLVIFFIIGVLIYFGTVGFFFYVFRKMSVTLLEGVLDNGDNLVDLTVKIDKLQELERLFITYEESVELASKAARSLDLQQEKLEKVYKFNAGTVSLLEKIAKQRGIR